MLSYFSGNSLQILFFDILLPDGLDTIDNLQPILLET